MDKQLELVAEAQGNWSATANALKKKYQLARTWSLWMSIGGALLTAIAGQMDGPARAGLAIAAAVLFAIVSILTARFLGSAPSQAWVRARAASEAMKREAYKYAARAAPYDDAASRGGRLLDELKKIETDVDDLLSQRVMGPPRSLPTDDIAPADYITKRLEGQVRSFFEPSAQRYQASAKRWRLLEFLLALATTILTAIVGAVPEEYTAWLSFDFAAIIAVLTTISGAILAHVEASRFDFLATSYLATARRLKYLLPTAPGPSVPVPSPDWSAFVEQCESILQSESDSWIAKFGKAD